MGFDIKQLGTKTKSEAGVAMTLVNPGTGVPLRDSDGQIITITLKGRNSQAQKEALRAVQQRRVTRQARDVRDTMEEARQDAIEVMCAITVTWSFDTLEGQPFPPTEDNIRKFWSDENFSWILEAAERFAMNDGNFLGT